MTLTSLQSCWMAVFVVKSLTYRQRTSFNPSFTKLFGTHTFYKGMGGGGGANPSMISKAINSTTLKFVRPLGLFMGGKKLVEFNILLLSGFHGIGFINCVVYQILLKNG